MTKVTSKCDKAGACEKRTEHGSTDRRDRAKRRCDYTNGDRTQERMHREVIGMIGSYKGKRDASDSVGTLQSAGRTGHWLTGSNDIIWVVIRSREQRLGKS